MSNSEIRTEPVASARFRLWMRKFAYYMSFWSSWSLESRRSNKVVQISKFDILNYFLQCGIQNEFSLIFTFCFVVQRTARHQVRFYIVQTTVPNPPFSFDPWIQMHTAQTHISCILCNTTQEREGITNPWILRTCLQKIDPCPHTYRPKEVNFTVNVFAVNVGWVGYGCIKD